MPWRCVLSAVACLLQGKTIMVTGATDGVGFEAARAFAEHGARVIIHGRNEDKARRCALHCSAAKASQQQLQCG